MKKFFNEDKVRKFFDILNRMERNDCERYVGRDKLNPDNGACEKDVFIQRTVGKWFESVLLKALVNEGIGWFEEGWNKSKEITVPMHQYICTAKPHFIYGHGDAIAVNYHRACEPKMRSFRFDYNFAKNFQAEILPKKEYYKIKNLFYLDNSK